MIILAIIHNNQFLSITILLVIDTYLDPIDTREQYLKAPLCIMPPGFSTNCRQDWREFEIFVNSKLSLKSITYPYIKLFIFLLF